MQNRFVSIWFRHLATDWFAIRQPHLKSIPFVLRTADHGRMIISAANSLAEKKGIFAGMVLADARAVTPNLEALDDVPGLRERLLKKLALWCIRFSPCVAIDLPDGLIIDASGCTHLWGGDGPYVIDIISKLAARGYDVRASMADTIGAAWGEVRYGKNRVIKSDNHLNTLMNLPPEALRLEEESTSRLRKLGLHSVKQFIKLPRASLRRRFGTHLLMRLDMALGHEIETIEPVIPLEPYQERLPCLEPIVSASGIEIGLSTLLESLCNRLKKEQKGIRKSVFKCYCLDGRVDQISIGTTRPTHHEDHLFSLFKDKIESIEPGLGIELFTLDATQVEGCFPQQEKMWETSKGLLNATIAELIDRLINRAGIDAIQRYLPDEHHWPERSFKRANSLQEEPTTHWVDKPRPLRLLPNPEIIEVSAPAFSPRATRRLDPSAVAAASAPFEVRSHAAGHGTAGAENAVRQEQWMPLWSGAATYADVEALTGEARATRRAYRS